MKRNNNNPILELDSAISKLNFQEIDSLNKSYNKWKFFFYDKLKEAHENVSALYIYQTLAKVCSLRLTPEKKASPYDCGYILGNEKFIIDDFTPEEIEIIETLVDKLHNIKLKARLADILWHLKLPTSHRELHEYLKIAAEEYQNIPLSAEEWKVDGCACYLRYIDLVCSQGKKIKQEALPQLENKILACLRDLENDAPPHFLKALSIVLSKLPSIAEFASEVAGICEKIGLTLETKDNYLAASECFELAAKWFYTANEKIKGASMIIKQAETIHKLVNSQSALVAVESINKAITLYKTIRNIPQLYEQVEKRISELRKLRESRKMQISWYMVPYSYEVNITNWVDSLEKEITSKSSYIEALNIFLNCAKPPTIKELYDNWRNPPFDSELMIRMPSMHFESDGRTVSKSEGYKNSNDDISEPKVQEAMLFHYLNFAGISSTVCLKGLDILHLQFYTCINYFETICTHTPLIPPNYKELFAKGLYAGYNGDFITSMHILAPQVENLVRTMLKDNEETTHKENGIEDEVALHSLLRKNEATEILGEDMVYSLNAIFCTKGGPNIRNKIAHGLFDDNDSKSAYFVYAWWFVFRWIFNDFVSYTNCLKAKESESK